MSIQRNNQILLTDIDGVVLDFYSHFDDYIKTHLKWRLESRTSDQNLSDWLGLSEAACSALIDQFARETHFAQIKPYPDAARILPLFKETGYEIHAITRWPEHQEATLNREVNLAAHFGSLFDSIICVGYYGDKFPHLEKHSNAIWVEDSVTQANLGILAGHNTFLIDRDHKPIEKAYLNENVNVVKSWDEIWISI